MFAIETTTQRCTLFASINCPQTFILKTSQVQSTVEWAFKYLKHSSFSFYFKGRLTVEARKPYAALDGRERLIPITGSSKFGSRSNSYSPRDTGRASFRNGNYDGKFFQTFFNWLALISLFTLPNPIENFSLLRSSFLCFVYRTLNLRSEFSSKSLCALPITAIQKLDSKN